MYRWSIEIALLGIVGCRGGDQPPAPAASDKPTSRKIMTARRPFRLSISLGAAPDAKRAWLVPIVARTPIAR
jgi:hypothetical protein